MASGIRINPLKQCSLAHLPLAGNVPWNDLGYYLDSRPCFTLDPFFHAGAYYVQDPCAMFPGHIFRNLPQFAAARNVLDLCAAPGGKSTDAISSLRMRDNGDFLLVSNEVVGKRAAVLRDNMALWGDPAGVVTSSDPAAFAALKNFFDIIIADVPCSGEAMFDKSDNARRMWSEDNVTLCAARQKRIVADAWAALAPGGAMVYSTCTFNDRENDDNVDWICGELGAEVIRIDAPFPEVEPTRCGYILGRREGEGGQYCAAIQKNGALPKNGMLQGSTANQKSQKTAAAVQADGQERNRLCFFDRKGEIYALEEYAASRMAEIGKAVSVTGAGVHAFSIKGRDKVPCADLALSPVLQDGDFPDIALDRATALRFLHGEALSFGEDTPTGYNTVSYEGLRLGFVKNIGKRANNLHPASRRIIMDVEGK